MLQLSHLLIFLWIICQIHHIFTQNVPPISCPQYFEYLSYGNQYIGKITIPNVSRGTTVLDVQLSQQAPAQGYFGQISLYQDQKTTDNNIARGLPISYRVDFPTLNVLPKLTGISVNKVLICAANDYPPPSTTLKLQFTLHTSSTIQGFARNPFELIDGFNDDDFSPHPEIQTFITPTRKTTIIRQRPQVQQIRPQQPVIQQQTRRPPPTQTQTFIQPQVQRQPPPQPEIITTKIRQQVAPKPQNNRRECGQEGSNVTPLINGGTVLARGQFPWMTAIFRKEPVGTKFVCGGSIISARTVISAAHCFTLSRLTADRVLVYLGRYDLDKYTEPGVLVRDIQNLIIHPEYSHQKLPDADLAILQLAESVTFSDLISPICLWEGSNDNNLIQGQKGFVTGWGSDENGQEITSLPKIVDVRIVSENDCVRAGFLNLTSTRTLCAGNRDDTGPCTGDSGGGLMMVRDNRWTLRAIVSISQSLHRRCLLKEYVVYCDVAKHLSWIRTNTVN